jgi:cbb3-type cytochrome oxidase subunit 3
MNELARMVVEYWLYWSVPLVFLAIVLWIYRPSARKRYKEDGNIPFRGD